MKKFLTIATLSLILAGCNSLSYREQNTIKDLENYGITVETPVGDWRAPANPVSAGALNLLPGVGNFYLATRNSGDNAHYIYGVANLLFWPLSLTWGVPEAVIDAGRINQRSLVDYYRFDKEGQDALKEEGLMINNKGRVEKLKK